MTDYSPPIPVHVRGDWMPEGKSYPALLRARWNGWAVPLVTREVAEQIVTDQLALGMNVSDMGMEWDDDRLRVTPPTDDPEQFEAYTVEPEYIESVNETLYDVGFGWTWDTVEDTDPGQPAPGQLAAFTRLKESVHVDSYSRTVRADGVHEFPVSADLGRRSDEGITIIETVARLRIDRAGTVTLIDTERASVYTVEVFERGDGVYVFADESDAAAFEDAVNQAAGYDTPESMGYGSACIRREQTVCDHAQAVALIAAELADA